MKLKACINCDETKDWRMLVELERIPVVCSVSEVGERTGDSVLSPAPPAVVGGLVKPSPS